MHLMGPPSWQNLEHLSKDEANILDFSRSGEFGHSQKQGAQVDLHNPVLIGNGLWYSTVDKIYAH